MYNLTLITQANTTLQVLDAIDLAIYGGAFFVFALVALFIILMINASFYPAKDFMLFASFFVSIIAGLLWVAGLVPFYAALVAILLSVAFMITWFFAK